MHRYLGCFYHLNAINSAAVNMGGQVSFWEHCFRFFWMYSQKWDWSSSVILFLIFWGNAMLFSIMKFLNPLFLLFPGAHPQPNAVNFILSYLCLCATVILSVFHTKLFLPKSNLIVMILKTTWTLSPAWTLKHLHQKYFRDLCPFTPLSHVGSKSTVWNPFSSRVYF